MKLQVCLAAAETNIIILWETGDNGNGTITKGSKFSNYLCPQALVFTPVFRLLSLAKIYGQIVLCFLPIYS